MSIAPTPARIRLPRLPHPPETILEFLCHHFPQVNAEVWTARVAEGKVHTSDHTLIVASSPYQPGITVCYYRETEAEIEIPFREEIIFQNEHLLVADKPHFLPVTPAGNAVNECLLFRLQRQTRIADLAPLHRLDRDTAGLVLFSKVKAERAKYSQLFDDGKLERTYLAVAAVTEGAIPDARREWMVENRIEPGSPGFKMKVAEGSVNARTRILLKEVHNRLRLFELQPHTGKKHQLRIHMMSIGFPILNDPFYPELLPLAPRDFSTPTQLLASELKFTDPITGVELEFKSKQKLACW